VSTLRAKHIPLTVIPPATRALFATGSGRATKQEILTTVRAWWPNHHIPNHDTADALVLAAAGAHHLGDPLPFPTTSRHTANLAAVKWPSIP
jgi:Holliday junction resolvasome RuvABC endonuclease subunit